MIAAAEALYGFFSGFGLPAYNEQTVPKGAELPYIVYQVSEPEWDDSVSIYVRVYYRQEGSSRAALEKADEITGAIGTGIRLSIPGGCVILRNTSPLVQSLPDEGDIHGALLNIQVNSYHMPGI